MAMRFKVPERKRLTDKPAYLGASGDCDFWQTRALTPYIDYAIGIDDLGDDRRDFWYLCGGCTLLLAAVDTETRMAARENADIMLTLIPQACPACGASGVDVRPAAYIQLIVDRSAEITALLADAGKAVCPTKSHGTRSPILYWQVH